MVNPQIRVNKRFAKKVEERIIPQLEELGIDLPKKGRMSFATNFIEPELSLEASLNKKIRRGLSYAKRKKKRK